MKNTFPDFNVGSDILDDLEWGKSKGKYKALGTACEAGNVEVVRYLIDEEKVDVNLKEKGEVRGKQSEP